MRECQKLQCGMFTWVSGAWRRFHPRVERTIDSAMDWRLDAFHPIRAGDIMHKYCMPNVVYMSEAPVVML